MDPTTRTYPDEIFITADGREIPGELHCQLGDDGLTIDFWPKDPETRQLGMEPVAANVLDLDTLITLCRETGPRGGQHQQPRDYAAVAQDHDMVNIVEVTDDEQEHEVAAIIIRDLDKFSLDDAVEMVAAYARSLSPRPHRGRQPLRAIVLRDGPAISKVFLVPESRMSEEAMAPAEQAAHAVALNIHNVVPDLCPDLQRVRQHILKGNT